MKVVTFKRKNFRIAFCFSYLLGVICMIVMHTITNRLVYATSLILLFLIMAIGLYKFQGGKMFSTTGIRFK